MHCLTVSVRPIAVIRQCTICRLTEHAAGLYQASQRSRPTSGGGPAALASRRDLSLEEAGRREAHAHHMLLLLKKEKKAAASLAPRSMAQGGGIK